MSRGHDLERLGRPGEAVALYKRLVETFAPGEDPEVDRPRGWAERRLATLAARRRERIARLLTVVAVAGLAVLASRRPSA
jgi:hypothetical protein